MILNSISAVLTIFIMIGIGFFASHKKWLDRNIAQSFPKLVINFSLPAQVLVTFNRTFTAEELEKAGVLLIAPFAAMFAMLFLAWLAGRLFKIPKTRRGVFSVLFAFSNSVFIGFPVAQALFGDVGMPYATFYYVSNTVLFWTFGYYWVKRDAEYITGVARKTSVWEIIKKVFSVPLLFVILSILLVLLNVKLPAVIEKPAELLGALTTPLSMIFIGCILYDIGFKNLRMEKGIAAALIGRFVVSCLVIYGSCMLFGVEGLAKNVYLTQMSLPAMTQTVITSEIAEADSDFAAKGVAWSTLLSLVTIPAIMLIFNGV
jgi:predicted permease